MIYTKTGDTGTTSLIGGTRILKCDVRVEAYGTVDELNAHLGLLSEMLRPVDKDQFDFLKGVQNDLFTLQTLLAAEEDCPLKLTPLSDQAVAHLEQQIDHLQAILPPLHSFVIPGGNMLGAQCHIARTICRRAERRTVELSQQSPVTPDIIRYLNRLSDYLFVLSRHLVLSQNDAESVYSFNEK